MEIFSDLIKLILPAALVLYGMFLTIRAFIKRELDKQIVEMNHKKMELVLPMRLQAYERMSIFLERITPNNLLSRFDARSYSATEFQHLLITEIRSELAHNYSQQIYVGGQAWEVIKNAVETLLSAINDAHGSLAEQKEANGLALARKIVEKVIDEQNDYTAVALNFLRKEAEKILF